MAVKVPGRHPAYEPIGRLRSSPFKSGKKSGFMELNLTAMVDMFTVIVIFLLQSFSGENEVTVQDGLTLPKAEMTGPLEERGPIVVIVRNGVLVDNEKVGTLDEESDEPGFQALTDRLIAQREKDQQLKKRVIDRGGAGGGADGKEMFEGHILVQADQKTDFELVRRVVYSANAAGWVHINFIVTPVRVEGGVDPALLHH